MKIESAVWWGVLDSIWRGRVPGAVWGASDWAVERTVQHAVKELLFEATEAMDRAIRQGTQQRPTAALLEFLAETRA